MPNASVASRCIGGINIQVVGLEELIQNNRQFPVAVLFILHGRNETYLYQIANAVIDQSDMMRLEARQRDPLIVILDQRNHGDRIVDPQRSKSWKEDGSIKVVNGKIDPQSLDNISHPFDTFTTFTGTAADVSFLITHLQACLFPNDEKIIDKWMVTGFSLGAHATWRVGAHDPRVTLLIPVAGTPTYLTHLRHQATSKGIPLAPPFLPKPLEREIERTQLRVNNFKGKDIKVLVGEDDKTVGFEESGCKSFLYDELAPANVCRTLDLMVQPKTGHVFTDEMVEDVKYFVYMRALVRTDWNPSTLRYGQ
ncbi:hypothetical protein BDV93DRAFT_232883 [Ceratobasidium sp. AG-I]|nr:hypothetical protein BDV93DRAFT_232883 [Ceratobasidium sp. AG-I]